MRGALHCGDPGGQVYMSWIYFIKHFERFCRNEITDLVCSLNRTFLLQSTVGGNHGKSSPLQPKMVMNRQEYSDGSKGIRRVYILCLVSPLKSPSVCMESRLRCRRPPSAGSSGSGEGQQKYPACCTTGGINKV